VSSVLLIYLTNPTSYIFCYIYISLSVITYNIAIDFNGHLHSGSCDYVCILHVHTDLLIVFCVYRYTSFTFGQQECLLIPITTVRWSSEIRWIWVNPLPLLGSMQPAKCFTLISYACRLSIHTISTHSFKHNINTALISLTSPRWFSTKFGMDI
jgi:hypothetical protein